MSASSTRAAVIVGSIGAALIAVPGLTSPALAAPGWQTGTVIPAPEHQLATFSAHGSGCKKGAPISMNGNTAVVHFGGTQMLAQSGGRSDLRDTRRFCQVSITPNVPEGHTLGIRRVVTRGTAWVEPGANGSLGHDVYIQGEPHSVRTALSLTQTQSGDVEHTTEPGYSEAIRWTPCDKQRSLLVKTSISMDDAPKSEDDHSWIWLDGHQGGDDQGGTTSIELITKPCDAKRR